MPARAPFIRPTKRVKMPATVDVAPAPTQEDRRFDMRTRLLLLIVAVALLPLATANAEP